MTIVIPQISKKDDLYIITYPSDICFKSKYAQWTLYYSVCCCTIYISLLFKEWVTKPKNLIMFDVVTGALFLSGFMNFVPVFEERRKIVHINHIREQHFWDNNFLSKKEKYHYNLETKISIYAHYLQWVYLTLMLFGLMYEGYTPQILYDEDWPYLAKIAVKCLFLINALLNYYVSITHEAYYAHIILHGCFQMMTLTIYLRQGFGQYKKMRLTEKVNSFKYQSEMEIVLKRCIKQHQILTEYGARTSAMYRKWILFQIVATIIALSFGTYYFYYDPTSSTLLAAIGLSQFILAILLYTIIGQQFLAVHENFRSELLQLDWYSLNRSNKQMYYMFLIFTTQERGIEILPSVYISRPTITMLANSIYAGLTFLGSTVYTNRS